MVEEAKKCGNCYWWIVIEPEETIRDSQIEYKPCRREGPDCAQHENYHAKWHYVGEDWVCQNHVFKNWKETQHYLRREVEEE